jgi:hypothetical protein
LTVELQDADGGALARVDGQFTVPKPNPEGGPISVQAVFEFNGLTFHKAGSYSFEIAIDGTHRRSIPLIVVTAQRPGQS